jgi:ferredoxin
MKTSKLRLLFPAELTGEPITYHLVKEYDLIYNIFHARITQGMHGELIIEIIGKEENINAGIEFIKSKGITVEYLTRTIIWDEDSCIHCGTCTSVCPSGALSLDADAKLTFDNSKCVVCEMCVDACPSKVIDVNFAEKKK